MRGPKVGQAVPPVNAAQPRVAPPSRMQHFARLTGGTACPTWLMFLCLLTEPAAAAESWLTGSIEAGYRWRTAVAGSSGAYRSVVDLGEGPKLFEAGFTLADPKKRLFDSLEANGTGWGDDPYTDDSPVCSAGAHQGLIGPDEGGWVTVEMRPAQVGFAGATRNGVTGFAWGPFPGSYRFVAPQPPHP